MRLINEQKFFPAARGKGHAVPIGTDLVLQEKNNPLELVYDGIKLGKVVEESAKRYNTPLAIPLMDLKIEKNAMLEAMGIPGDLTDKFHFENPPTQTAIKLISEKIAKKSDARMGSSCHAIHYIATQTDLFPIGMCIGPFSLLVKVMSDPITAVYLKGAGMSTSDEPSIAILDSALELSITVILEYLKLQIHAGAKAIIMCEPAANKVYLSPKQLSEDHDIFDECVINYDKRIKSLLDEADVDLIYHDCGELEDVMIRKIAGLHPSMISLGSSRKLWEDARFIPKDTVLYGNLPTKHFYSDELTPLEKIPGTACVIVNNMKKAGHPFILGSECDVLSVPGRETALKQKVKAFLECSCH